MFNAYWEALDFELPLAPEVAVPGWQRWIDTSLQTLVEEVPVEPAHFVILATSVAVDHYEGNQIRMIVDRSVRGWI